jgi:cytidylate kinase
LTIVAIDGHLSAGASEIGQRVADYLGCDYYDRLLIIGASRRSGTSLRDFLELRRRRPGLSRRIMRLLPIDPWRPGPARIDPAKLHRALSEYIREVARAGDAVLVHRGAGVELRGRPDLLRVGIFAPWEYRVRKLMRTAGYPTLSEAASELAERERRQIAYFMQHYGEHPHDRKLYDLELTNSLIGQEDRVHENLARQVEKAARRIGGVVPAGGVPAGATPAGATPAAERQPEEQPV